MKLKKLLVESIEESLDLEPTKDLDSMLKNLYTIAFNYGSRKMAFVTAMTYVSNHVEIFNKLREKSKIDSRESFERFMGNLQSKARSEANKLKKANRDSFNKERTEHDIDNIIKMAIEQEAAWQKRIADKQ